MSNAQFKCPTCKRPALPRFKPFCSSRCADVDLGRWLGENYKVATEEQPSMDPSHVSTQHDSDE